MNPIASPPGWERPAEGDLGGIGHPDWYFRRNDTALASPNVLRTQLPFSPWVGEAG